jgi:hypothetical protein
LWFFKSVGYGASTKWTETQQRLPQAQSRLDNLRQAIGRNIETVKMSTFARASPSSLWQQLGADDTDTYKIAIANLHHVREQFKRAVHATREEVPAARQPFCLFLTKIFR